MHNQASYVYINPKRPHEKWSTFEEYQPEICLYYLGAMDKDIPPTEGYTLETRLDGFIDELAYIGRAHNWDNKRIKMRPDGELFHNEDSEPLMEEYDDLEKDRPSCFSGVKRRLFQSVRGHALLSMLTTDIIDVEIHEFVREHLKATVNEGNRLAIKTAWDKMIEGDALEEEDLKALRGLDISLEKQDQLIAYLADKYRRQFTSEPAFAARIKRAFIYKKEDDAQLFNFGHIHPEAFFEDEAPKEKSKATGLSEFIQSRQDEVQPKGSALFASQKRPAAEQDLMSSTYAELSQCIQAMLDYGMLLKKRSAPKGQVAIDLATSLAAMATQFFEQESGRLNFAEFKQQFSTLLHSKDKAMSAYRISWGTIVANIAIALTGIGLLLIAAKLIHSNIAEGRTLCFFQKNKTTCEKKIADIEQSVNIIGAMWPVL